MIQLPLFDIVYTCLSDIFFLVLFLIKLPVCMKEIYFKFGLLMLAWALTWGEVFKSWINTWVQIQSGKPRTLKSSQKHVYTVKSKKKKNCIPLSELQSYRVDTFKTRKLFELPITKAPFTKAGPALRGSGVGNWFEVVLVPAGLGGGQLLVELFLLTASFLGWHDGVRPTGVCTAGAWINGRPFKRFLRRVRKITWKRLSRLCISRGNLTEL